MCGIVGLHLKNPDLQPRLGELLTQMLEAMTTRGPDSAGIAVYADRDPASATQGQELRYSLRSDETIAPPTKDPYQARKPRRPL
jgi:glutamate synthase domain-containing protein 1